MKSLQFMQRFGFIPISLFTVGFVIGGALDMKKTGLIIFAAAMQSLIALILIPGVKFGEMNIRGVVYDKEQSPVMFYITFYIFLALGPLILSVILWIVLTWNI